MADRFRVVPVKFPTAPTPHKDWWVLRDLEAGESEGYYDDLDTAEEYARLLNAEASGLTREGVAVTQAPMGWEEVREEVAALHEELQEQRDCARCSMLSPDDDIPAGTEYRRAFADLLCEVTGATARAEQLLERLAASAPPPARLEAVLAEIVAEGHGYMSFSRYPSGSVRVSSQRGFNGQPAADAGGEAWAAYKAANESGDVDREDGDLVAAAEARLGQIRGLRAEKRAAQAAIEATWVHYDVGDPLFPACGAGEAGEEVHQTADPAKVTCPTCQAWVGENVSVSAGLIADWEGS